MPDSSFRDLDERPSDAPGDPAPRVPRDPAAEPARPPMASLYRTYRPNSFDAAELVGQDHIVRTLKNAIALDRVAHAYLFSGPRGTGKTTTARLLAKAVNCLDPDPAQRPCNRCANCNAINAGASPDIIEIDAASNRGIDDIRDLRERVRYAPTQLPSMVYIIDEAHQITGAAANAFLKTLEEPPAHSRFILATTDPEELLPTIVSRCQRFEFRRISADAMAYRLRSVADHERIEITDDALRMIARHATGSLRDALGLLEQLALLSSTPEPDASTRGKIDEADVRAALGLSRNDRVEGLADALARRNPADALRIIQEAIDEGEDPRQLNRQLLSYLRLLLVERSGGPSSADDRAKELAQQFSLLELASHARRFSEIDFSIKHAPFPQLPLEVAVVEATAGEPATPIMTAVAAAATPEPQSTASPRPMSLRERVRNPTAYREASLNKAEPAAHLEPTPITPLRPAARPAPVTLASNNNAADVTVEQIVDLWPRVRADVKALNRRIEALLSEVDPVAVSGKQITLAVPYPFHRDKLNSDEVRETVAGVLSRLLDRDVSLLCILRGEMPPAADQLPAPIAPEALEQKAGDEAEDDEEERTRSRVRAAKNIFDAEEIDPSDAIPSFGDSEKR